MFDNRDFFREQREKAASRFGDLGQHGAVFGRWLGFFVIVVVLAFSGWHGINATAHYRAGNVLGVITGIVGIVCVELVLFSLILKWHNRSITGVPQKIAALVAFAVGVTLTALATITDSRLNAGLGLTAELEVYLLWVLPASPLIMGLLNHIVDELSPEQLNSHKEAEERRKLEAVKFDASIAQQHAEIQAIEAVVNAQLNARTSAATQIARYYQSEPVQRAIEQSAIASVPALLRAIGVDPSTIPDANGNQQLDLDDVAAHLAQNPDAAARLFGLARKQTDRDVILPGESLDGRKRFRPWNNPAMRRAQQRRAARRQAVPPQTAEIGLDEWLASVDQTRESARSLLDRYGLTTAEKAYNALKRVGKLPAGVSRELFDRFYGELMAPETAAPPPQGETLDWGTSAPETAEQWRVAFFNRHGGPEYVEPLGTEQDAISLASNLCRSDPMQGDYLVERFDPAAEQWVTMHVVRWGETAATPGEDAPFRSTGHTAANGVVRPGTGAAAD